MTEEAQKVLPERLRQKSSTYLMDKTDEAEDNYSDNDDSVLHEKCIEPLNSKLNSDEPVRKRQRHEINQTGKNQILSHYQNPNSNEFICSKSETGKEAGKEVFKRVKHRTPVIQKSLAVVLASLQGVQVVIELKNDVEISGIIEETDSNMNLTLNQVKQVLIIFLTKLK